MVISTIRLLLSDVWFDIYFFFSIDLKTHIYHSHKLYHPQPLANERTLSNDPLAESNTYKCCSMNKQHLSYLLKHCSLAINLTLSSHSMISRGVLGCSSSSCFSKAKAIKEYSRSNDVENIPASSVLIDTLIAW